MQSYGSGYVRYGIATRVTGRRLCWNAWKAESYFSGFDADAIDRTTAADLAEVGSDKWTRYPGCIGAFIAEMDYGLAPCIQQAIDSACDHCKLGYIPEPWKRRVAEACAGWQKSHYGWDVDPDIIRVVPDVLEAYEIFLRELVGAGNAVVVPTPAYMPFLSVPKLYDVDVIEIEMLQGTDETTGEREWLFDFNAIEHAFAAGCHAFVLCNPHNPIGKVLTLAEEQRLCELAERYDVRISMMRFTRRSCSRGVIFRIRPSARRPRGSL